ncbi:carbon-nitrogen hydrolase [Bordetella genomosp. 8]|uniref:Carbon-nitrogen hydrolase n=1 Tax=Bordetella genomosp. 8 TaxID=1416806 RepID=A0A1W6YL74_9BORD|nr:carbon-nitrogen hydrolase family protein [Bordetella genomosp. 8]ARP81812.1 carbon-nitrogen hydrolase [Bordetella genomosp. 8]
MKASIIQMNSVADKQRNIDTARRLARQAIEEDGARLVSFPEHFDWAGGSVADKVAAGEAERDGPAYDMCRRLAIDHGIHVHTGSFYERSPDPAKVYNTSVVFDPQGREIARYRKIHLFDIVAPDGLRYGESDAVMAGREPVVAEIDGVVFGLAICYDLRFPELFQMLVKRGAQVILLPASFTLQTGKDHWEVLCRARAIETQCYFLAPAQVGPFMQDGERRHTYGHTLVCDPWGHVVAKASDEEGFVTARIEPALVRRVREQIPLASHKVL